MGNYLTSQGVARQENVQATYLSKEDAQRLYATNDAFRAEIDRIIAEDNRLNLQHTDFVSGTFNPLSTRVGTLRTDVDTLRTDASGLRTDLTGLQTNAEGLRTDLTTLQTNHGTLNTNFNSLNSAYYGFVENQFNPLSTRVGTLRTDVDTLTSTVNENNDNFNNWRNTSFNTTASNLENLQGQFDTLNTNYNTHIQNYNEFSAGIRKDLGSEILRVENKFNSELGRYATLEDVNNLNSVVQSGLSAQETATIKSILNSTEFGDALTSLGIQREQQNNTITSPSSHLRTRNYMLY